MCHRKEYHLRCGHITKSGFIHCSSASLNHATRRWRKCSRTTGIIAVASDELCGKLHCVLSVYNGRWICCRCKYGYRPGEVNRHAICVSGNCSHSVCWGCLARTEENIREMYAEEEMKNTEEVEEAVNEDISLDSIVFDASDEGDAET